MNVVIIKYLLKSKYGLYLLRILPTATFNKNTCNSKKGCFSRLNYYQLNVFKSLNLVQKVPLAELKPLYTI